MGGGSHNPSPEDIPPIFADDDRKPHKRSDRRSLLKHQDSNSPDDVPLSFADDKSHQKHSDRCALLKHQDSSLLDHTLVVESHLVAAQSLPQPDLKQQSTTESYPSPSPEEEGLSVELEGQALDLRFALTDASTSGGGRWEGGGELKERKPVDLWVESKEGRESHSSHTTLESAVNPGVPDASSQAVQRAMELNESFR